MKQFQGPKAQKSVLDNGLEVYTKKMPTNTVTLSITVRAGSFQEDKHFGIAHLTEHMVFKGTKKRDVNQINEEIESVGGLINAETNFEYTRYYCTVPSDAWQTGLDVICDIAFNALIPEDELVREKVVVQEEISMYDDNAGEYVTEALIKGMNTSYPNRQSIAGTRQSVGAIERQDIVDFMGRFYKPDNMFVLAIGNIDHHDVTSFMQKNYPVTGSASLPVQRRFVRDSLDLKTLSTERHIEQAHLAWGLFGPAASAQDAPTVDVMATILGGSMTSRLYRIIREERGLAYTVHTHFMSLKDTGIIMGYTGLDRSKLQETRETILEEFERLRTSAVTPQELQRAKNYMQGVFMIQLERTSAMCSFINGNLVQGTSIDPNNILSEIDSVTEDAIMSAAKRYITPDNWMFSEVVPILTR